MEILMLTGHKFQVILEGTEKSDSGTEIYTRSRSHYLDGEYSKSWATKSWGGTGRVIRKSTGKKYFFNFSTFVWRDHEVWSENNDTSFKRTVLFVKGKDNHPSHLSVSNESLFFDCIAEAIIKSIREQKRREGRGALGINIDFQKGWLTERMLLDLGVLAEENGQTRLALF